MGMPRCITLSRLRALTLLCVLLVVLLSSSLVNRNGRYRWLRVLTRTVERLGLSELPPDRPGAWLPSPTHVTVVTAVFPDPFRHPITHWLWFAERTLEHVRWPLVIFTTPELAPLIRRMRSDSSLTVIALDDVFDTPPVRAAGGYAWALAQSQSTAPLIPQRRHPMAMATWASKAYFLDRVASSDPFASQLFFWADCEGYEKAPLYEIYRPVEDLALLGARAEAALARSTGDRDLMLMSEITIASADAASRSRSEWPSIWVQGTIFGGSSAAVRRFADDYAALLLDAVRHDRCVVRFSARADAAGRRDAKSCSTRSWPDDRTAASASFSPMRRRGAVCRAHAVVLR